MALTRDPAEVVRERNHHVTIVLREILEVRCGGGECDVVAVVVITLPRTDENPGGECDGW